MKLKHDQNLLLIIRIVIWILLTFRHALLWLPKDRWLHRESSAWYAKWFRVQTRSRPSSWYRVHYEESWRPIDGSNGWRAPKNNLKNITQSSTEREKRYKKKRKAIQYRTLGALELHHDQKKKKGERKAEQINSSWFHGLKPWKQELSVSVSDTESRVLNFFFWCYQNFTILSGRALNSNKTVGVVINWIHIILIFVLVVVTPFVLMEECVFLCIEWVSCMEDVWIKIITGKA